MPIIRRQTQPTLMLNYIWGGLIGFSFLFAIVYDFGDLASDTYRNGEDLTLSIRFPEGYDADARSVPAEVTIMDFGAFYGVDGAAPSPLSGSLVQTDKGREIRFGRDADLPVPLGTIRQFTSPRDNDLRGPLTLLGVGADSTARATVRFRAVRFTKMQSIVQAAFDMAETAVNLALGLIGVMALWMGLIQIAEKAGMLDIIVRITQPALRKLFPDIPDGHPAFAMIVLNLSANVLGLANAATPLGIKAMESLQELNPEPDTATDSMVMLLAMNTASVQLVPPVLLVAIMGLQVNELIFAIIIVTSISLGVAILSAKLLSKRKKHRLTNPMREGRK
ncbi:MAG: spore maturation protein A [Rhodothermales bacterium]|jgi:spore maturation protein A